MTDLEMIDNFCETCLDIINPKTLRDICKRNLYGYVNLLPENVQEAKAVARARLSKNGKFFGDVEIDQIAGEIKRLEFLRSSLVTINSTDVHKIIPILKEMMERSEFILNYFKPTRII